MTLSRAGSLHVVIIGAGFGGLSAAKQPANARFHFLTGFRNRLAVAMHWCWNYATFQRGTRLISGISGSRIEDMMPVLSTAPALAASAGDSGGTLP